MRGTLRSSALFLIAILSLRGYSGEAEEILTRARALVLELKAGPDATRDATMRRLAALGPGALPAVQEAARSPKAEVARRAQELVTIWQRYARLREETIEYTHAIDAAAGSLAQAGPLAFDALVAAYAAEPELHWRLRDQIINLLPRIDPERALGFFQTLLAGNDEHTKAYRVLPCLGQMGNGEAVRLIISALLQKDSNTRLQAEVALGKVGDRAVDPLLDLLGSKDPEHRARAARAFGHMGDIYGPKLACITLVLAALDRARDDPEPNVQAAATVSLISHSRRGFGSCFTHRSATVRAAAVEHAAGQRWDGMCEQYLKALHDPSPEVRKAAAHGLEHEKGPRVVAALIQALDDDSQKVLLKTLYALRNRRRDPVPTEKILRIARDAKRPVEVRAEAIGVLASLGGDTAMEALLGMAQDPQEPERVRTAAATSVFKIKHPRVTEFARNLLRDKELRAQKHDDSIYPCTSEFLGEVNLRGGRVLFFHDLASLAVNYLMRSGGAPDAELVVAEAIGTGLDPGQIHQLAKMGKAALPALERAATQGPEAVRLAAVCACQSIEGANAVPLAVQALRDPSATVRAGAAHTLGLLGDKSAAPALVPLLDDKDDTVRVVAATTLVLLGDERAKAQAVAFHKKNLQLGRAPTSHWYDRFDSAMFLVRHAVRKGMTKAQVEEAMGYPPGTTGKADRWFYSIGRGCAVSLEFAEGKLVKIFPDDQY